MRLNLIKVFASSILMIGISSGCADEPAMEIDKDMESSHGRRDQNEANILNDYILDCLNIGSKSDTGEPILPPFYGGSFIEPDGNLKIFVVGDSISAVSKIKKISDSEILRFQSAEFSYQELLDVNQAIVRAIENGGPMAVKKNISAFGLNVGCNAVEVYLIDNSETKIEEFKKMYNHPCLMFSQLDRFVNEASDINPGDKVCKTISTLDKFGSIAFRAQETSGEKRKGFVTAGHVLAVNADAYIDSVKMGVCVKSMYDNGGKADAAFVVVDSDKVKDYNLGNYINGVKTSELSLSTRQPGVGTYVNKWGAQTGNSGGYIKNTVVNMMADDKIVMQDLVSADYKSAEGDSGGIVYAYISSSNTRYTVGVHKGSIEGLSLYSKADNVLSALGLKRY